jgi:hypothetical protein
MTVYPLPQFREGVHWRRLSPAEGKNKWRYVLLQDITFTIVGYAPLHPDRKVEFSDKYRRVWATLHGREFRVKAGYASNGSSPKRYVTVLGRKFWAGTPDFEGDVNGMGGTLLSNFLHDPMRQFAKTAHMPYPLRDLKTQDELFLSVMKACKFGAAGVWYWAVRAASFSWRIEEDGQKSTVVTLFAP